MNLSKRILFYTISDDSVLMINTLTGALDIIDSKLYDSLMDFDRSGQLRIDTATIEALKRRGYLFDGSPSENQVLRLITEASLNSEKRLRFVVCPTYSCNLRCTYCFEGDLPQINDDFMGDSDIEAIFSAIDSLRAQFGRHQSSVDLFGGEPLLPRTQGFVRDVLREAKRRSLQVTIVTNGIHVDHFADILGDYRESISSIQVTLDGPKEVHDKRRKHVDDRGSFDRVSSSIDALLSLQIRTAVRVNVDLQNIDSIGSLYKYMRSKQWTGNKYFNTNIAPVQDHTLSKGYEFLLPENELVEKVFTALRTDREMANVFQLNMFRTLGHIQSVFKSGQPVQPLPYYCEANNLEFIVFGPDGRIYACTECMGNTEMAIGEFRPQLKLYDIAVKMWNGRNVMRMEKCRECDIALLCGGGCAYSALVVNGNIDEPVCNNARETIYAYLDYIREELARKAAA